MSQLETTVRARFTAYTTSLLVILATYFFFTAVPFIPAPPFIPLLVALALGALSLKEKGAAIAILYILVFMAEFWQMIGFGFFQLLTGSVGVAVIVALVLPLLAFIDKRVELSTMSLAILCVALMFTPAYFVSIPLMAAAAAVTSFASLGALLSSFILFLAPFLLLDNALYYTISSSSSFTPVAFGQLTSLSENFRPALSGLNLFLKALPGSFVSPYAPQVSVFLTQDWQLIVIPLILVGLAFLAASLVGGIVRSFLKNLATLRESQRLARLFTPLAISLVVPGIFVVLIELFSLPSAGAFRTSLTGGSAPLTIGLMLTASVLLGGAFVARDYALVRTERGEVSRERVEVLLGKSRSAIKSVREQLGEVGRRVPSISTGSEQIALSEYSSYLDDVERRFRAAGAESLSQWNEHIDNVVLPSLAKSGERLKSGILNELRTLGVVAITVNGHLEEASAPLRYTPIPDVPPEANFGELLDAYNSATQKIEKETLGIFAAYRSAIEAYGRMTELHGIGIPVSPDALLGSHEYVTAMRLVGEEYWLNFHLRYSELLDGKKNLLLQQLRRLRELLTPSQAAQLDGLAGSIEKAVPAGSTALLKEVEELHALLGSVIKVLEDYPQVIERALNAIGPKALEVFSFQTPRRAAEVASLRRDLESSGDALDGLTRFIAGAIPLLAELISSWKMEQESLRLLAHYPIARRVIEGTLAEQKREVSLNELPYRRRAAILYARLYACENPKLSFDEKEEVLILNA